MNNKLKRFLQIVPVIIATAAITASQTNIKSTLDEDKRQAEEVAATFLRRITATRDVRLLKDMFLADYVKRRVEVELSSLGAGQPYDLLPSIPIRLERDLVPLVSQQEWERFYNAKFNLKYLWLLTLVSRFDVAELERQPSKSELDVYPPQVSTLLRSNRFIAADHTGEVAGDGRHVISKLADFLDLIATLEKATAILREEALKSPPEERPLYKENLRRAPEGEGATKQNALRGVALNDLPSPKEIRFYLRTKPEFFELTLVKTDSGVKIVWATVYPYN